MFQRELLNQLRADGELLTRIVGQHLSLSKAGSTEWKAKCPFHQEKTASFHVIEDKGFCHCFGCGWGGDVFDFVQELNGLNFVQAVMEVADEAGVQVERSEDWQRKRQWRGSLLAACKEAHSYYRQHIHAPEIQTYLRDRGLLGAVDEWELGYAPDLWSGLSAFLQSRRVQPHAGVRAGVLGQSGATGRVWDFFRGRLMFPIKDSRGRVVGFAGRAIAKDQQPKYINTPETELYNKGELLFGLAKARPNIQATGTITLVEGYTDVIACHTAGAGTAVATCGTALTDAHVTKITRLATRVVEAMDPDRAGMAAMEKSLTPLLRKGLQVDLAQLPGLDPDELLQEQGEEALHLCLEQAVPLLPVVFRSIAERHPWTPQGRKHAAYEVVPLLQVLGGISRDQAIKQAAQTLNVSYPILRSMVGNQAPSPQATQPVRRLDPMAAEVIWALSHHTKKADPMVRKVLHPDWLGPQERIIIHSMMKGIPVSIISIGLEPWAATHLRQLAADRMRHGAGRVSRVVRESCKRIELSHVESMMGSRDQESKFKLQQRRLKIMDELALPG